MDKPAGPSSFAVVRQLRDETGARAGHAGTLDPFATGLLLVLLGAATRLARYLVGLDKRYVADVDLRSRTRTGDREGDVLEECEAPGRAELEKRLDGLRGTVSLPIPTASAVKIGGERAYRLARRGVAVDMPVRRTIVHELALVEYEDGVARIDTRVSSGTYIRSLADALGGHCATLRRTRVGPFDVARADRKVLIAPVDALSFLEAVQLSEVEAAALRQGRTVAGGGEGPLRLVHDGSLVGVGRARKGQIRSEAILP